MPNYGAVPRIQVNEASRQWRRHPDGVSLTSSNSPVSTFSATEIITCGTIMGEVAFKEEVDATLLTERLALRWIESNA